MPYKAPPCQLLATVSNLHWASALAAIKKEWNNTITLPSWLLLLQPFLPRANRVSCSLVKRRYCNTLDLPSYSQMDSWVTYSMTLGPHAMAPNISRGSMRWAWRLRAVMLPCCSHTFPATTTSLLPQSLHWLSLALFPWCTPWLELEGSCAILLDSRKLTPELLGFGA